MKTKRDGLLLSLSFWISLAVLVGVAVMTHQNTLRRIDQELSPVAAELPNPSSTSAAQLWAHAEITLFVMGTILSVMTLMVVYLVLRSQVAARKLAEHSLREEKARLEWQSRRYAALAEIELAINEHHELGPVLERIVARVMELLPATAASVILWDARTQHFAVSASSLPGQGANTASRRVRQTGGATRWIIDHKQPLVVRDVAADPFVASPMLAEFDLHSYVGVPLIAGGAALGVIYAMNRQARDYSSEEINFLTVLAGRAAMAVTKVRQFDELQGLNDSLEARVRQRTEELERVNVALSRSKEFLQAAIDALSAHISIVDDQSTIITVNRAWREFAEKNGFRGRDHGIGLNYLAACDRAEGTGAEEAAEVADGLRAVLNGTREDFRFEYPCHGGGQTRWFQMRISRLAQSQPVRLAIAHENVTDIKLTQEALRALSGRLMHLRDEERRHIARELHDSTGQNLAAIAMNLVRLQKLLPQPAGPAEAIATESLSLAEQCQREIRTLSYLLHPPMLDEAGLISALRWFVDGFTKRSGIPVDLVAASGIGRLPADVERAMFRVVQESLANIHRHAHCRRASVQLLRLDHRVTLEIIDDGCGMAMDPASIPNPGIGQLGVGIMGMRERLRLLGGRLEIETGAHGTRLRAWLPMEGNGK